MKRPVSMPCTEAQFEAMKPKLEMIKDVRIDKFINDWIENPIITNNYAGVKWLVNNVGVHAKDRNNRTFYPEFNEQIFLEACGYVSDSLEERVAKLEEAVLRLLKTEDSAKAPETKPYIDYSRIKTGSKVVLEDHFGVFVVVLWNQQLRLDISKNLFVFYRDGVSALYLVGKDEEINFISEVVEY